MSSWQWTEWRSLSDPGRFCTPEYLTPFFTDWNDIVLRISHPEWLVEGLAAMSGFDIIVSPDPALLLRLYYRTLHIGKPVFCLICGQSLDSFLHVCRAIAEPEEDNALILCSPELLMTDSFHKAVRLRDIRSVVVPDAHRAFCQDALFAPELFLVRSFAASLVSRPHLFFLSEGYPYDCPERVLSDSFGLFRAKAFSEPCDPPPAIRAVQHGAPQTEEELREELFRFCSSDAGNVVLVCPDDRHASRIFSLLADRFPLILCTESLSVRDMARAVRRMTEEERYIAVTDVRSLSGCPMEHVGLLLYTALPRSGAMLARSVMHLSPDAVCTVLFSPGDLFTVGRCIDRDLAEEDYSVPDEECRRLLREAQIRELGILSAVLTEDRCLSKALYAMVGIHTGVRCGICSACDPAGEMIDCSEEGMTILRAVGKRNLRFSAVMLERFLYGTLPDRPSFAALRSAPDHGCLRTLCRKDIHLLITALIRKRYLKPVQYGDRYRLTCTPASALLMSGSDRLWIPEEKLHRKADRTVSAMLSVPADPELYRRLKSLRISLAAGDGIPTYAVFGNAALHALAASPPDHEKALAEIPRFPKESVSRYGKAVLACIREYRETRKY